VDSDLLPSKNATKVATVRISNNARKHGVSEDEMLHAIQNHTRKYEQDDGIWLYIGASGKGTTMIEVGVLTTADGEDVVIHAMRARPKLWP